MNLNKIYLFVEGIDDVLFMQSVFVPVLAAFYHDVEIIQYAQMKRAKTVKYIESIDMLGFDYLVLADIDQEASIKNKKQVIQHRFPAIDYNKIIVVIAEIESWYLAGIPAQTLVEWGFDEEEFEQTEFFTKEDFNLMPGRLGKLRLFHNRTDFMQEILKCYDLATGAKRNQSLAFLCQLVSKHGQEVSD